MTGPIVMGPSNVVVAFGVEMWPRILDRSFSQIKGAYRID